ncbi:hypothetical protein I3843_03G157100 [Carya illinoinensis]|nr:hypothetical protein I3843_03G157100 [Carya illinoinensis]
MIGSLSLFSKINSSVNISVKLPNGSYTQVTHTGTVRLSNSLVLTYVLYVPTFTFNLISIDKLVSQLSCFLLFLHDFCCIQDLSNWRTIGVAKQSQGLYHLMQVPDTASISCKIANIDVSSHCNSVRNNSYIWHCALDIFLLLDYMILLLILDILHISIIIIIVIYVLLRNKNDFLFPFLLILPNTH